MKVYLLLDCVWLRGREGKKGRNIKISPFPLYDLLCSKEKNEKRGKKLDEIFQSKIEVIRESEMPEFWKDNLNKEWSMDTFLSLTFSSKHT